MLMKITLCDIIPIQIDSIVRLLFYDRWLTDHFDDLIE